MEPIKYKTVGEYFSTLQEDTRPMMEEMRKTIKQAAPKAVEVISYNMPAIKQHSVLVYYAANKEHIGFYPTARPIEVFKKELAGYKTSKGAIQFPLCKPIPKALVKNIVKFRMEQDAEKAKNKKAR